MDLLQEQKKKFYEDHLSSRKGQISEEVDKEYEQERRKLNGNFTTTSATSRGLRCNKWFECVVKTV